MFSQRVAGRPGPDGQTAARGGGDIVALIASVLLALTATTSAALAVDWPHEPAGFVPVSNQPWDALGSLGWSHLDRGAQSRIVADPTAPLSPVNVLEHLYPAGFPAGVEPAIDWHSLPAGFTEGFVGMWWKPSLPWQGHASNVNKIYFVFGSPGHIIPVMYGPPGGPYQLRVAPEQGNWSWLTPNVIDVPVALGAWHKLELYFKQTGSTVAVRWWMDGTLLGDFTNVPFSSTLQELQIAPTWGGVGGAKTESDYFRYDQVYFSRPGGGSPTPPMAPTGLRISRGWSTLVS